MKQLEFEFIFDLLTMAEKLIMNMEEQSRIEADAILHKLLTHLNNDECNRS